MTRLSSRAARAALAVSLVPVLGLGSSAGALKCAAAVHVAARHLHVAAVQSNGSVWTWGANWSGQLGDDTFTNRNQPVQVLAPTGSGFLSGVVKVSVGVDHTLALKSDGTVLAWGGGGAGVIGDGTNLTRKRPVQVTGVSNVVGIAAGQHHSLALTSAGDVYSWGTSHSGQLGNGTTTLTPQLSPGLVTGISDIVEIAAGDYHSLARKADGTIYGWGWNFYGQATGTPSAILNTPNTALVTGKSGVSSSPSLVAGGSHTLVVTPTGTLQAFGRNDSWQVGQSISVGSSTAIVPLITLLPSVSLVGAGYAHSFAVSAGVTYGWGENTSGELAEPSGSDRPTPVPVSGATPTTLVTGGYGHSVAIVGGTVLTWGNDSHGQLGDGPVTGARFVPAPATCTP